MKCPECGNENPEGSGYCEDCGSKLAVAAAEKPLKEEVASPGNVVTEPAVKASLFIDDREFVLVKDVNSVGRRSPADGIYPDVDLTDDDPDSYISRRHAQIIREEGKFIFEDTGSSNGSFINGARMEKGIRQVLKNGDHVKLGRTEMIFRG